MLCKDCSGNMHIMNIGKCKSCGSMTSSGSYKLCAKCAVIKNECAACSKPLNQSSAGNPTGK
jgi:hypothetical protein